MFTGPVRNAAIQKLVIRHNSREGADLRGDDIRIRNHARCVRGGLVESGSSRGCSSHLFVHNQLYGSGLLRGSSCGLSASRLLDSPRCYELLILSSPFAYRHDLDFLHVFTWGAGRRERVECRGGGEPDQFRLG